MTHQETARELVEKFRQHAKLRSSGFLVANEDHSFYHAKQCTLIAVDEILEAMPSEVLDKHKDDVYFCINPEIEYWQQVRTEIEKL